MHEMWWLPESRVLPIQHLSGMLEQRKRDYTPLPGIQNNNGRAP